MQKNKTGKQNLLPTVVTVAALSSCLMFGIIGTYRLTAGAKEQSSQNSVTETELNAPSVDAEQDRSN